MHVSSASDREGFASVGEGVLGLRDRFDSLAERLARERNGCAFGG